MPLVTNTAPLIDDRPQALMDLAPLAGQDTIELGCGGAGLARLRLQRHPDSRVTGLEVDARQADQKLAAPQIGLHCCASG